MPVPGALIVAWWAFRVRREGWKLPHRDCKLCAYDLARELGPVLKRLMDERRLP